MAKKISTSQKIGNNSIDVFKYKLKNEVNSKKGVEFIFVEIPQQFDFGLDGLLNIFCKDEFQPITPFVQVKGTNTAKKSESKKKNGGILGYKIDISDQEWYELKNRHELVILIGVNTKTEEVYYVFPKFEEKPESWYLHNFPAENKLEPNQESKQNLFQKIQYFQGEIAKQNQREGNSIALSKGENFPLVNGFEAEITSSGLSVIHKDKEYGAVELNLSSKFKDSEQKKRI